MPFDTCDRSIDDNNSEFPDFSEPLNTVIVDLKLEPGAEPHAQPFSVCGMEICADAGDALVVGMPSVAIENPTDPKLASLVRNAISQAIERGLLVERPKIVLVSLQCASREGRRFVDYDLSVAVSNLLKEAP